MDRINIYRVEHGLNRLTVSDNLVDSSGNHLDYLLSQSKISHIGLGGSTILERVRASGSAALTCGEIIGYSPEVEKLFNMWTVSSAHNSVMLDPKWNWVGVSIAKQDNQFVVVVNFSSGNLGSIKIINIDHNTLIKGAYLQLPTFTSRSEIWNLELDDHKFSFNVKGVGKGLFIYVYNDLGQLTDRVEYFF